MGQIMDLAYRYNCVATNDDRFFIWIVSVSFIDAAREAFSANRPVDEQDSSLLVHLFTCEIHPYVYGCGVNKILGMIPPFVEFGVSTLTHQTYYLASFLAVGIFARAWWDAERKTVDQMETYRILQLSNLLYQFV